jgi:hypothetical protein
MRPPIISVKPAAMLQHYPSRAEEPGAQRIISGSASAEVGERVAQDTLLANFEVEVGTGAKAGAADAADHLPTLDRLATGDDQLAQVSVECSQSATVLDHDVDSVPIPIVCCQHDPPGSGG